MSDIKMSDVFNLPLYRHDDVIMCQGVTSAICDKGILIMKPFFHSENSELFCDYTVHAINSHDRLVEQNKALVAQLSSLLEATQDELHMWSDEIDTEMKKTIVLLTKIKGE